MMDQMLDSQSKYWGKYRGVVVNNSDTTLLGRLQVQVPAVLGLHSVWALPCVPYAGKGQGLYALPDIGAQVWVEFEGGDPAYPIWVGCFWKTGDLSPQDAQPHVKMLKTKGVTIRIDELKQELVVSTSAASMTINLLQIALDAPIVNSTSGPRSTTLNNLAFDVNKGGLKVS